MTKEPMFLNHYTCPTCNLQWEDEWSATCDDDCPRCGARHMICQARYAALRTMGSHIEPDKSTDLEIENEH